MTNLQRMLSLTRGGDGMSNATTPARGKGAGQQGSGA